MWDAEESPITKELKKVKTAVAVTVLLLPQTNLMSQAGEKLCFSLKPQPLFKRTLSASQTRLPGRRGMNFLGFSRTGIARFPKNSFTSSPSLPLDPNITLLTPLI